MSLPFTEHIPIDQTNYGITPDTLARQKEPPLRHPSLPHIHAEFYCFPNVFPTRNPVFQFYPVDHAQLVQMPSLHTAKEIEGTPPALYSKYDGFQIADYGLIYNNIYGEAFIYYVSPASLSTSSSLLTGIDIQSHLLD